MYLVMTRKEVIVQMCCQYLPAPSQLLNIVQNTFLHAILVFYIFILNYIKKTTFSH